MRARLTVVTGQCAPATLDLFPGQPVTLGRSRDNMIVVRDELASRLHAKIVFDNGRWVLRDFALNGTWIDGERVISSHELTDGNEVRIGGVTLRFVSQLKPGTKIYPPVIHSRTPPEGTRVGENSVSPHSATKVHELPPERGPIGEHDSALNSDHLQKDELTALCKFMSAAVELQSPGDLIVLALQSILQQTHAKVAGYLSLDPDDPTPKVVLPQTVAVDVPLSRKLTQRAQRLGKPIWMSAEQGIRSPTDSLHSFADAVCIPLKASGESFAALHVYRSGHTFCERDVRFIEASAAFLAHALEIHRNRRSLEAENCRLRIHTPVADDIIGESSAITQLRQLIVRAAPQNLTVLVQGESGAGKELVALALHRNSKRSTGPLVVVNCAAIAPSLLEAELFGYRKGAFSGALRDHPGLFQQADEGTLFLDEVAELSVDCQAKLLRVIEGKSFRPVGATHDVKVDVRIIAATHRNLEQEVSTGRFRADLAFRLSVIRIRVPPLREHPEDIPELANYFLVKVSNECRRRFRLTPAAMSKLQTFAWPGNVRQLRAVIESAAVMSESDTLDEEALRLGTMSEHTSNTGPNSLNIPTCLDMEEIETWAILRALKQTQGNVSHASKLLGISRDTLHTKMKKKKIVRDAIVNSSYSISIDV